VKVWIYKGDILPYKATSDDKISKEAAMAVGESAGQERPKVVSTRRAPEPAAPVDAPPAEPEEEIKPLVGEADPEFERLLAEEEAIEASTREHHETPHFRPGDSD
jgi:small subunit ribosomal protein S3